MAAAKYPQRRSLNLIVSNWPDLSKADAPVVASIAVVPPVVIAAIVVPIVAVATLRRTATLRRAAAVRRTALGGARATAVR